MKPNRKVQSELASQANDSWLESVPKHVASRQFGLWTTVLPNVRAGQTERTEKVRLDRKES